MFPSNFGYAAPRTLAQALELLAEHGDGAKLLAGGHSLIPALKLRLLEPAILIDLGRVDGLRGISLQGDMLVVGAGSTHAEVAASPLVQQHAPLVAQAAAVIGDVQVRNRGTIGGSSAHADPAADYPVALTAAGASFVLASQAGERTVQADEFFVDYLTTALEPTEVLTQVRIPVVPAGTASAYAKLPHPASGYVVVSAGVLLQRDAAGTCTAARVAVGGLAGTPHRAAAAEAALMGSDLSADAVRAAAALAAEGADPEGDVYASADYKRAMAAAYVRRAIESALGRP